MSRRVPEFALVIGVFLGLSALVFGLALGWGLLDTVVLAALGAYPFAAFGLLRDDDPSPVVPARWVLAGGVLWAVLGVVGALAGDPTPSGLAFAAFVGLALGLPPAAYAVSHGAGVNPLSGRTTLAVGLVAAVGLLVLGLLSLRPVLGAVDAVLVALAAGLYVTARGVRLDARTRRAGVAAGALLGVGVVALGVARGDALANWALAGIAVAFAPSLFVALSRNRGTARRR